MKNPPKIAKVLLDLSLDRTFDYAIPPEIASAVRIGMRVMVPFGVMSIILLSSFVIRMSPSSVLLIRWIVMLPISSAMRRHAVWISGQSLSRV